jgi:hypothetical protein
MVGKAATGTKRSLVGRAIRRRRMQHIKTSIATLVSLVAILGIMGFLFVSSDVDSLAARVEMCDEVVQCDIPQQLAVQQKTDEVPTLAPPRDNNQSLDDNSDSAPKNAPLFGQTVYVQVKTDHAEIEVGWASSEKMGR